MKKTFPNWLVWVLSAILLIEIIILLAMASNKPGPYDKLASCLTEKKVTFFGAFWCPHCQEQKKIFGNSTKLLPYVECSTPDGQDQNAECKNEKILGYPTWQFPNGDRVQRVMSPEELAQRTGCSVQ